MKMKKVRKKRKRRSGMKYNKSPLSSKKMPKETICSLPRID